MTLDDLKRLATGSILFSLDRIIAPRLINILYLLGLAAIVLWAISHFFATFSFGFGTGLWGLLEIVVFGLLGFVVLRIVCEAVIVFFKANERAAKAANQPRATTSLIDEVRDAIEELAERDYEAEADEAPAIEDAKASPPKSRSASARSGSGSTASASASGTRKTARRTPPKKA